MCSAPKISIGPALAMTLCFPSWWYLNSYSPVLQGNFLPPNVILPFSNEQDSSLSLSLSSPLREEGAAAVLYSSPLHSSSKTPTHLP